MTLYKKLQSALAAAKKEQAKDLDMPETFQIDEIVELLTSAIRIYEG